MQGPLGLLDDHLVATAHENADRVGILASLDDQLRVVRRAKPDFSHRLGKTELVRGKLLEPRHDPSAGGQRKELDLHASNPSDCWKVVMHQQMVGLVVETPLADDQPSPRILAPLHHVPEVLLLLLPQRLKLLDAVDVYFMLDLRLGRLERTRQDRNLDIRQHLGHLRVAELLIEENTLHQR